MVELAAFTAACGNSTVDVEANPVEAGAGVSVDLEDLASSFAQLVR